MKKRIFTSIVLLALLTNVSAQIEINSSNQVGIGTTNPQYKLDVAGDTRVTGNFYLGSSSSNFLGTTSDIPVRFKVNNVFSGTTGSSGNSNVAFGYAVLSSNSGGLNNTANGYYALYSNTGGWNNTAVGYQALYSNTGGSNNTATGCQALYSNMGEWYNTATGSSALYSNTNGRENTATGSSALYSNTVGRENTATGYRALYYNTGGAYNIATGPYALHDNTTGGFNTAIGWGALVSNTTGNYNAAIGRDAGVSASNLNNTTAIGYNVKTTASNQVRIGNSSVTSIGGYAAWSTISDGRAKKNIRQNVPGLAFINSLQPVTYNLDLDAIDDLIKYEEPEIKDEDGNIIKSDKPQELVEIERKSREAKEKQVQTGFVAQDVEQTAKSLGYDFSGVDVDETGIYSLRYSEFVVPLVKAVQELSEQNNRLQEQVKELNRRIELLERK